MGMIEKRGKNSWRVGVQIQTESGKKWVRRTIRLSPEMSEARQYREAEKALARLVLSLDDEDFEPPRPRHTVRSFAELWMEQHVVPNLAAATQKNYRHFLDARILPALGDILLEDLTPLRLTQWLNDVRRSPRISTALPEEQLKTPRRPSEEERMARAKPADMRLSARTVQHYYDTLEAMLKKAVQWDVLEKNPMEKVDRPVARKKKANYLTEERAVELLRCLREEPNICFRAALLLALLCGLRLGEVGALRLSDVDWERGTIDISRALKYTPQTGSFEGASKSEAGERLIALPASMMAVLHEAREYQRDAQAWAGDVWVGEGWIVHGWNGAQLHHDTPSGSIPNSV